jgi:hypothetical protein
VILRELDQDRAELGLILGVVRHQLHGLLQSLSRVLVLVQLVVRTAKIEIRGVVLIILCDDLLVRGDSFLECFFRIRLRRFFIGWRSFSTRRL